MYRLALTTLTLAIVSPQIASAADQPCLSPKEATAVAAYAMPSVIGGATSRCAPVLGGDSWLARNGNDLAGRYAARKVAVWPETRAALFKFAGSSGDPVFDLIKSLPDATIQKVADGVVTSSVTEKLPTSRCGIVEKFLSLVAPLPPENTAELIALTLGVMAKGENPRIGKLAICKA